MGRAQPVVAQPHRIEHALRYLREEWGRVPRYVDEWPGWSEDKKLDFVTEWPIREDQLAMLRFWAGNGDLDAVQVACHREIEELVARNRPLI